MYLLFGGENYYPAGGWNDYEGTFQTLEEAVAAAVASHYDWWEVVELQEGGCGRIVKEGVNKPVE